MTKLRITSFFIAAAILLPAVSSSQTQEIKEYTVQKGDTLWDISNRELKDSFLWPKIWKENPEIKNPDRIYPGQTIRIPLYLLRPAAQEVIPPPVPVVEAPRKVEEVIAPEAPPKPSYLIDKRVLLASGYVAETIKSAGRITGAPSGRNLFGNNDIVYIRTDAAAKEGERFIVIRQGQRITHPASRLHIGYVIEVLGIAEVQKTRLGESMAKIVLSFKEITTGDLLQPYLDMTPPLTADTYRMPDVKGYVVATRDLKILNGDYDIVFIDKGKNDGIEAGDIMNTVDIRTSAIHGEKHLVPTGVIQVISIRDKTATAIVKKSTDPVRVGALVSNEE